MSMEIDNIVALAVDTSGRAGSIALGRGANILSSKKFSGNMRHAAELISTIQSLLKENNLSPNDIQCAYITNGPGSYTGLRIAATMAKMMALANDVKIYPISTLDAMAMNAYNIEGNFEYIAPIIDAKRGFFFVSLYKKVKNEWIKVFDDHLTKPDEFMEKVINLNGKIALLGEGLKYYSEKFKASNTVVLDENFWEIDSRNLYAIGTLMANDGESVPADSLVPDYMRLTDAEENLENK